MGLPRFDRLCWRRFRLRKPNFIAQAAKEEPAVIFAFDILWLNGQDMRQDPLRVRKAVLKQVLQDSDRIRFAHHISEGGEKLFAEAEKLKLEGIVAKRATFTYPEGGLRNG